MFENFNILPEVFELFDEVVTIRREIHQHPELMFDLPITSKKVSDYLKSLNIEVLENIGISGVVGIIRGEGPCILLRADMDALPVTELTDVPYKSRNEGIAHVCGHDAHTAILMVTAKVLSQKRHLLKGSVKFMFQPAEEGGFGALKMIEDPVHPILLCEPKVDEVYGLHVSGIHPVGAFGLSKIVSSYNDFFEIQVIGKGGHMSGATNNPVTIGAELIQAFQNILSRNIDNFDRAVISITAFNSGEAINAVPENAWIKGTTRSLSPAIRELMNQRMKEICNGIAEEHSCAVKFKILEGYPPTINSDEGHKNMLKAVREICPKAFIDDKTYLVGEDFSYLTNERSGAFLGLGARNKKPTINHSPDFDIDERSLLVGVSIFVQLIFNLLGNR